MTIKKVLKSLQMTGHALRLDVESIAAFNKWIANPESVVLGGFCSDFSIEGKFHVLTKGSTDLSIPYNLKITASDITYGLIEVEKYSEASQIIENSVDVLIKKYYGSLSKEGDLDGWTGSELDYIGISIKEGCLAYVEMFQRTDDEAYLDEGLKLFEKIYEIKNENHRGSLLRQMRYGSFLEREVWMSKLNRGQHPEVIKHAIEFYIRGCDQENAKRLTTEASEIGFLGMQGHYVKLMQKYNE